MTGQKASGVVEAVHPATSLSPATVDVQLLGSLIPGLRYPQWYTPSVGDLVVVDWIGSQPYVSVAFF